MWDALTGCAIGPPLTHKNALVHFMPGGAVLATASPDDEEAQRDLSMGFYQLGFVIGREGDYDASRIMLQKSLEIRRNLVAASPTNGRYLRDLVEVHQKLAEFAKAQNKQEEASLQRKESYRILQAMHADGMNLDWIEKFYEELRQEFDPK